MANKLFLRANFPETMEGKIIYWNQLMNGWQYDSINDGGSLTVRDSETESIKLVFENWSNRSNFNNTAVQAASTRYEENFPKGTVLLGTAKFKVDNIETSYTSNVRLHFHWGTGGNSKMFEDSLFKNSFKRASYYGTITTTSGGTCITAIFGFRQYGHDTGSNNFVANLNPGVNVPNTGNTMWIKDQMSFNLSSMFSDCPEFLPASAAEFYDMLGYTEDTLPCYPFDPGTKVKVYKGNLVYCDLPDGYQEVEYIECSNSQYVDLGFIPQRGISYTIKASASSAGSTYDANLFGARSGAGSGDEFCLWFNQANSRSNLTTFDNKYTGYYLSTINVIAGTSSNNKYALEEPVTIEYRGASGFIFYNDVKDSRVSIFPGTTSHTNSLWLFRVHQNTNDTRLFRGRFFGAKFTAGSCKPIRDLVCCFRKSDSVIGLYDLVEDVFYVNAASGQFVAGPVVGSDRPEKFTIQKGDLSGNQRVLYGRANFPRELEGKRLWWNQLVSKTNVGRGGSANYINRVGDNEYEVFNKRGNTDIENADLRLSGIALDPGSTYVALPRPRSRCALCRSYYQRQT